MRRWKSGTHADADGRRNSRALLGYAPLKPIEMGVKRFVDWYRDFYRV